MIYLEIYLHLTLQFLYMNCRNCMNDLPIIEQGDIWFGFLSLYLRNVWEVLHDFSFGHLVYVTEGDNRNDTLGRSIIVQEKYFWSGIMNYCLKFEENELQNLLNGNAYKLKNILQTHAFLDIVRNVEHREKIFHVSI